MLKTIVYNGQPIRAVIGPSRVPYVNVTDVLVAAGLADKTRTSHLKKKARDDEIMMLPRRAALWGGAFGTRGSATILFLSIDALDRWARPHPDGEAVKVLRMIREELWKPFASA